MGTRGPAPKGYSARERDQARRHATNEVAADGQLRGFELPQPYKWHPATVNWWQHWRESPIAQLWQVPDWDFALSTAAVHTRFWENPTALNAAELRQREAKMGQTYEDRQRLHITILDANGRVDESETAGVTAINEYRKSLTGRPGS